MKTKLKSILAIALCAVGLAAFAEPAAVAQFVKVGEVVAEFETAEAAVEALDDAKYKDIEEFRIGLTADTEFDFGGRTNRVVIGNVGAGTNTLKNVLLDCAGDYVVTGMVGTVVFGDGVRIERETLFKQGLVNLIIKDGLYKSDPSNSGYCEGGYFGARRCDANAALNGLYAILPEAKIAVEEDRKKLTSTRYATLQDAFNLIGENEEVTLRLFNNLELGTAVTKLEGNKSIRLLPGEAGANTITRIGPEPVIEIGREAKLAISNVVFNGANVTSEKPMIEVVGKGKPPLQSKFGWLIADDGFVVSNAVGGAVHVGDGGKFELDGVAKIIDNTTSGKPKNVIIEDSKAILLTASGAVTDGNYAQIGVSSDTDKFMIPGGQFGEVNLSYEYATYFADGDISVAKPWVGFINDRDGTLHHAAGAKIAAAPTTAKKTYKRWVGGEYKVTLEEGDYLISREKSIVSERPELIWTARQDAPAAQPAPALLDWTDTTLTLAVSNGCDYALVTSGSAETNWVSMVKTDSTYAFARPAGDDYLCLRRYSITPSNIVSAATAYSVRIPAGTKDDPWTIGEGIAAWTNGNEFVVSGDGTVSNLSKLASKVTVEKLTIKDATVTVAASDAFQGFGASGAKVSLTLPDGWQGELPDDGGNWYGAKVELMAYPLAVKNVTTATHWPWDGKIDVTCGLTGSGKVQLSAALTTNGVTVCTAKAENVTGETEIDIDQVGGATNGVKFVWNAKADCPADFNSTDTKVKVTAEFEEAPEPPPEPEISAESEAFAFDVREEIPLAKGAVTIAGVSWSATLWGAVDETFTTVGWTNLTTGATGEFGNLSNIMGEGKKDVTLPKKDGDYVLTHSTGDLTSFVKFTVSGYPLGSEGNPWEIGANAAAEVIAFSNGTDTVSFKPVRGTVTKAGLETVTNAMGGASFTAKLIAADGSKTNDLVMVLGASGTAYDTIADALAADEASYTLFETDGYFVSYDGNGAAGTMGTDKFVPIVPTNLTANAYTAVGYAFAGWTTNGVDVAYADRASGVDFAEPGETLALTALWNDTGVEVATFDALTNALVAATNQAASLPVTVNLTDDITVPQGGVVKVYARPAVTFAGTGTFDVSAERPALFCGYPVGTGLKPEDLGRFVTDKDVKAYFEDGKVVVRGRGETDEFPWLIGTEGHEDEVTAWAGNEMILTKPTRGTASVAALQSVTNALNGYVPGLGELKVISADGSATNNVVMLLGSDGVVYDTLADVFAANPRPETVRLFEVKGYFVSYDGNGAAGTMATDTFLPTVPTNLTVNAYSAVGYVFEGWTTNGCDEVAYEDGESGVDFAEPGETLALRAKWVVDPAGVKPANYVELTNLIAQATLPVTLTIEGDIALAPGDGIVIPDGKDVSFDGEGKFDVSGVVPQFGEPVTVGEGLAEGDLDRFDADGVSKPVFEDGKVGLVARGETEDFPWVVDEENGVTAWVDPALTNLAAVVIDNGMPAATNEIDLVSLTNNLAVYGYEPAVTPLNAFLKVEDGGETAYVMPVNWITEQGNVYKKLEEALAAGETVVVPNFVTEEIPEEIAETGKGADGKTYAAVIENVPAGGIDTPVKAISADGLLDLATSLEKNVKLVVEPVEEACIPTDDAEKLAAANTNGVADVIGYTADYVDLSLYFNEDQQSEIGEALAIHVPWAINPRQVYRVSRIHEGVAEPLPVGAENAVGGEYVEIRADGFVIHAKNYSLYAIGEITLQPRFGIVVGSGEKALGEPDPSYIATNFTVNVQGLDIEPGDIAGYCVRAKGEAAGDYAINFICTKCPQGYDGELVVLPGVFTIRGPEMLEGSGTVKYPAVDKKTGYLKNNANASWTATPAMGCVFAGWGASDGAPECVTSNLVKFSENELRNARLTFKVGADEQVAPTDVEATWARIDEDVIGGVALTAGGLDVTCKSYVTATVSGLPSGLKFDAKTLAITGTAKKNETKTVKVSVKNASGYTWKQSFAVTVSGGAITEVVPADDLVTTGVPVMLWCDPAMGLVKGTGVYALGKDGTKKVTINATAKTGYVFAGWYEDPGFAKPAYELMSAGNNKDYRQASQTITVTEPTYLFARFVEKTTKADPITWLRFEGAGYCGAANDWLAEDETWYQGVALPTNGCAVAFGSASLPTVTVTGLPAGVKFDKEALRFTGVPTACSTEKKPFFTVKISVKNKSGATDVLVRNVRVEPLPAWTVGNFDGYHMEEGATNGTFTATVGKTGKVSGKTKGGLADTTFSAKNFSKVFTLDGSNLIYAVEVAVSYKDPSTKKTVKATDTLYLMEDGETKLGVIGGGDRDGCGSVGVQRAWDRKTDASIGFEAFPEFNTKALKDPVTIPGTELTLKFGAKGKVTVGGKVNGIKVSGSTYVLPFAWHSTMTPNLLSQVCVYVAPTRNTPGFCAVYDVLLTVGADGKFAAASVAPPSDGPHVKLEPPAIIDIFR